MEPFISLMLAVAVFGLVFYVMTQIEILPQFARNIILAVALIGLLFFVVRKLVPLVG